MKIDRNKIWYKFNGHCSYCGCELKDSSGKNMQVDHMLPLQRNWWQNDCLHPENETIENLFPSCGSCNNLKSSLPLEAFRKQVLDTIRQLERTTTFKRAFRFGMIKTKQWDGIFYFENYENE